MGLIPNTKKLIKGKLDTERFVISNIFVICECIKNKKIMEKIRKFFSQAYGLILFFSDTVFKSKISTTHFFLMNNK